MIRRDFFKIKTVLLEYPSDFKYMPADIKCNIKLIIALMNVGCNIFPYIPKNYKKNKIIQEVFCLTYEYKYSTYISDIIGKDKVNDCIIKKFPFQYYIFHIKKRRLDIHKLSDKILI